MHPDSAEAGVAQEVRRAWADLLSAARQFGYAVDEQFSSARYRALASRNAET